MYDNFFILLQISRTIDRNLVVGWMHGSVDVCMCGFLLEAYLHSSDCIHILGLSEKLCQVGKKLLCNLGQ